MTIKFLKAFNGDSIFISFRDSQEIKRNILIDGGVPQTFQFKKPKGELRQVIDALGEDEIIDLLILTHVDDDHIGGILKWLSEEPEAYKQIGKVWFNSGRLISELFNAEEIAENHLEIDNSDKRTSIKQGTVFEKYIADHNIWQRELIEQGLSFKLFGLEILILSPNRAKLQKLLKKWGKEKPDSLTSSGINDYDLSLHEHLKNDTNEEFVEDTAIHNGSSIAILIIHNKKNYLFLGDAHPGVLCDSLRTLKFSKLNPLEAELVKLSHHGSKSNNSKELFELVKSEKFVVSTNGAKHNHPHKQLLARLIGIHESCLLYFNYPELISDIFMEEDYKAFPKFKAIEVPNHFEF